jgi:SAM-dependent methyltransferase
MDSRKLDCVAGETGLISIADRSSLTIDSAGLAHGLVCPGCRAALTEIASGLDCGGCGRAFPTVAGLSDLRLAGDPYLSLEQDRAKAERLARIEPESDMAALVDAYYVMTDDVDVRRRARYRAHVLRAEARGAALDDLLPRVGRILEIGCGSGGLLAASARAGKAIVGLDIALRWLVVARRRLRDHGLRVPMLAASAERLPWPDGTFDAVVADSVLEHLNDPAQALRECYRVLRPSGRLIIWSPNRFALTSDPHVGLLGVGWLSHGLASAYVRMRRGCAWTVRPLSACEARRLAASVGIEVARTEPPRLDEWVSRSESLIERLALRLYGRVQRHRALRAVLLALGPLWQLTARKEDPA